ncbi:MAG: hypothetical protein ACOCYG_08595 [Spirochaetota bacterium]
MHVATQQVISQSLGTMPTDTCRGGALRRLAATCAALVLFFTFAGGTAFSQGGGSNGAGAESDKDLDLREANVTAVEVEPTGNGAYRFSVTLIHDDDGEDGYANWWQVETLTGERLGRRDLLHAHSTAEFTRSETIQIPSGTSRVVVRGHDQTHGYGGQAAIVDPESGDVDLLRQGEEPMDFSDREE